MADIQLDEQSAPSTPAAGSGILYPDSTSSKPVYVDDAGVKYVMSGGGLNRAAVASQGPGFATDTYVTDSGLIIPGYGLQAQTRFRWDISASKTAAGTAAWIVRIRIGSAQTTADTTRVTLTAGVVQSAVTDVGVLTVIATVRTVSATGVIQGAAGFSHLSGANIGFANGHVEAASAGFDNSALAGQFIGLSIDGGASAAWTITQVLSSLQQ